MKTFLTFFFGCSLCVTALAQPELLQMMDTEKTFAQKVGEGTKSAFLEFLADDSVIFRPNAVNGKQYWMSQPEPASMTLVRKSTYGDISANGLLGYTTGNWRLYPKGKSESPAKFGQFVTIWEKKPDGNFRASVDIGTTHEKLFFTETDPQLPSGQSRDFNKRGWSAADPSMNFLRMSMSRESLGGAYAKFAAADVRLLLEDAPPITGRKKVVEEMNRYVSIDFPKKIALFQSADMAYLWNACEFSNNNEGTEKGNCLQIWKLRNKKWWIVLGVFARIPNETEPILKNKSKNKKR